MTLKWFSAAVDWYIQRKGAGTITGGRIEEEMIRAVVEHTDAPRLLWSLGIFTALVILFVLRFLVMTGFA
jgi:hypothetical protein